MESDARQTPETEFHADVDDLRRQIHHYSAELEGQKEQIRSLMFENSRLKTELKESMEGQLIASSVDGADPSAKDFTQNLQHQLQKALDEKDHAMQMWQLAQKQVEDLEQQLQKKSFNPQIQMMQQQAHKIKEQYLKTTEEMNEELKSLHSVMEKTREQLAERNTVVERLQLELHETKALIGQLEQDKADADEEKEQMRKKISQLHSKMKELEASVTESECAKMTLKDEMKMLDRQHADLQRKCAAYEQFELDAVNKLKTYARAMEETTLEKDQAVQRERQRQEEVEQLQKALSDIMTEAAKKAREEVDLVKKACNQAISKCKEEIHNLEMEMSEKQTQFERLMREKRLVENELDRYRKEEHRQLQKDTTVLEDLTRRACNAERTRDEALMKVDGLQNQIKRLETGQKQDRKQLDNEINLLKELNSQLSADLDQAQKDRVHLQEQVTDTKNDLATAVREKEVAQRNVAKLKCEMEHDIVQKQKEFEVRVETIEEGHRQSQNSIRQLLAAQQKVTNKWKEESETASQRFEAKAHEMQAELTQQRKRNAELVKLVHEMQAKVAEAEKMLSEYTRHIHKLEERLQMAEDRSRVSFNVPQNGNRNRNIVEERRQMQRELERNLKEAKNLINVSMSENSSA